MTQAIEQAVCDILGACQPVKIILYAEKRTMATDKLKAFSLCVIVPESANCRTLRTHLHLAITVSVPVSLSVYTTEEWAEPLPTAFDQTAVSVLDGMDVLSIDAMTIQN